MTPSSLPPYDTHLPVLRAACLYTRGPILELGMGQGSTPFLHDLAETHRRDVWSYENAEDYFAEYLKYRSPFHHICLVYEWMDVPLETSLWAVALVDQAPAQTRAPTIARLRYGARVVVAHDSEPSRIKAYRYDTVKNLFQYRREYTELTPHTLLLSNYVDVNQWVIAPWE